MIYCKRCLYPNTKPDLFFDERGICSACIAYDKRSEIDWKERENVFYEMARYYKNLGNSWDCIIPVSGGKDSTYQIVKALEYGLRPLAVTATTDDLSIIGRHNLDNISSLGVDHIEITTNTKLRRKINKYTLETVGDISWAEHVTIFTIPIYVAQKFGVPLIIWGENPQNEYGGPLTAQGAHLLNQRWLEEFGGLNGLRVSDLLEQSEFFSVPAQELKRQLFLYTYPQLNTSAIAGIFLGHYFPWDGLENARISAQHGFQKSLRLVEGVGFDYENLDNYQTGIHDYFKYIKFGFGRATDLVNNHIRRGYMTREEGKAHILEWDGQWPEEYLGKYLYDILEKIEMNKKQFIRIVHTFMNKKLFSLDDLSPVPSPNFLEDLHNA